MFKVIVIRLPLLGFCILRKVFMHCPNSKWTFLHSNRIFDVFFFLLCKKAKFLLSFSGIRNKQWMLRWLTDGKGSMCEEFPFKRDILCCYDVYTYKDTVNQKNNDQTTQCQWSHKEVYEKWKNKSIICVLNAQNRVFTHIYIISTRKYSCKHMKNFSLLHYFNFILSVFWFIFDFRLNLRHTNFFVLPSNCSPLLMAINVCDYSLV